MNLAICRLAVPVVLAAFALGACTTTQGTARQSARATLMDASGKTVGTAVATGIDTGIRVNVEVAGLTPGRHGVHIHTVGRCDAPDFTSAGGHWNPGMNKHGLRVAAGPHRGDLPNLDIGADGRGTLTADISGGVILDDASALLDADGAAFMVHADADDMVTDPSGNSGGRIACGVFAKA